MTAIPPALDPTVSAAYILRDTLAAFCDAVAVIALVIKNPAINKKAANNANTLLSILI
jgi:hypothetical protein